MTQRIERLEEAYIKTIKKIRTEMAGLEERLTSQHFLVLALLLQNQRTVTEIAAWLAVKPSAVTSILDRMHENRLILRERDKKDRRLVMVRITSQGETVFARFKAKRYKIIERYISCLVDQEKEMLVNIFERMASSLETTNKAK